MQEGSSSMHRETLYRTGLAWLGLGLAIACAGGPPAASDDAASEAQTPFPPEVIYSFGYELASSVESLRLSEAELERMQAGVADRSQGRDPQYGPASDYHAELGEFLIHRLQEVGTREAVASQAFLEAEAQAPGALRTERGAVLTVEDPGSGEPPTGSQIVYLNYRLSLRDGTVTRATPEGEPFVTPLPQANLCWKEALARIGVGGRVRAVCSHELAFGLQGRTGWAPPGAAVIWDLELVEVGDP